MNRTGTNPIDMGFTRETFPAGTHMCLVYSDESERRRIIGKYLESGVRQGEQVSYFADTMTHAEVQSWLAEMDIELPAEHDGFAILDAVSTYCPEGSFVPETMLENLREFYSAAKSEGYPGTRVSGEMSWALKGIPGSDRLMEYEALVNVVVVTHPITAICQYDARRFSGQEILNVLRVHPKMIVRGQVVHNPYYMKPEDFLDDFRRERT